MCRLMGGPLLGKRRLSLSEGGVALGELGPESFRIRLRWERPASPVKRFAVKLLRLCLPVQRLSVELIDLVVVEIRGRPQVVHQLMKLIEIGLIDLYRALAGEDLSTISRLWREFFRVRTTASYPSV